MRLTPRSLSGRLMLAAAGLTLVALVVAGLAIGVTLHRFVDRQLEDRLDQQTATIADALERGPDGRIRLTRNADGPPFDRPRSGWYWRAASEGVELRSASLETERLDIDPNDLDGPPHDRRRPHRPRSGEARGPRGAPLFVRVTSADVGGRPAEIVVAAPLEAAAGPMRDAMTPLFLSLGVLGLLLAAASVFQVRLGLKPVQALRRSLQDVRAGRSTHVPGDQPLELQPLADELNALIDQNAAGLSSARLHVANLAHGLKTPLATLGVALAEPGRDPDGALKVEIDRIDRSIRHHLARARAAALGGPARMRTPLRARIDDLAAALSRIHAERGVTVAVSVAADVAVACDPQDVDEMVGNLLDNAFKWARKTISVEASESGRSVVLTIADDGPGLAEAQLPEALRPGARLDEATPGHGFGLSITRELAELYGGDVVLSARQGGGLTATLTLPAAA